MIITTRISGVLIAHSPEAHGRPYTSIQTASEVVVQKEHPYAQGESYADTVPHAPEIRRRATLFAQV